MESVADLRSSFEVVGKNEIRLVVMGEIISAQGFEAEPLCVHYIIDIPSGWKNDSKHSNLQGLTHNCYTTDDGFANFSHQLFFQLSYSMDSQQNQEKLSSPLMLFTIISINSTGKVKYEGYGYINIPSTPGTHLINMRTWKLKPRSIEEQLQELFIGVSPSLQDIHAVHIPVSENKKKCERPNRFGLHTLPSGSVKVRLNVIHQCPASFESAESKFDLLEKMSSATILKSVQAVIEAFHRAKKRAAKAKQAVVIQ